MSRTTKSAIALARKALDAGREALPAYAHRFAPKKFTQAQLFAILTLRQFFKVDYRGITSRLKEWAELRVVLGLGEDVPHYSTLCYAERRLFKKLRLNSFSTRLSSLPAARS